LCAPAEQVGRIEHEELLNALSKLEPEQREAVTLVGASGLSYEEVSEICNCPIGTVKSRVHRARVHLAKLLSIEHFNDLNGDPLAAALSAQSSRKGGWSSEYPGRRG
jgi:RNA polymerase sigma-70 factor (ECF subfamily)